MPALPRICSCARDGDTGKESCDSCAPGWTYSYDKGKCVKDKPKKG